MNPNKTCFFPNCWADTGAANTYFCNAHSAYRQIEAEIRERTVNPPGFFAGLTAVYVIGSTSVGAIKIGIAADVMARLATLQTAFPHRLSLYSATYTSRVLAERLERKCHKVLTDFDMHLNGEWFDAEPNDACKLVTKCAADLSIPVLTCIEYGMMVEYMDLPLANPRNMSEVRKRIQADVVREALDSQTASANLG